MISPENLRRTNYPFLGKQRLFPETAPDPAQWFRNIHSRSPSANRDMIRWGCAFKAIFGVKRIGDIPSFSDTPQNLEALTNRFREAFAQRHRIGIVYDENDPAITASTVDFGLLKLENTRHDKEKKMTKHQVDQLMSRSLELAKQTTKYLDNPQTGLLRGMTPAHTNEPMTWKTPIKHFLALFDQQWTVETRYECRRLLSLMDPAAEYLLYEDRIDEMGERIENIFDNYLCSKGPIGYTRKARYVVSRNPKTYAVEALHFLKEDEKYHVTPFTQVYTLYQRRIDRPDGSAYYLQWNEEPKSGPATVLKMLRNNTLDPTQIRDLYRMSVVMDREQMNELLADIKQSSIEAEDPVNIEHEENALDGDPYQALNEGEPHKYAASSIKYQVMRERIRFQNDPELFCELSLYTPEAYANWLHRIGDGTATEMYLVQRQLTENKFNEPTFLYMWPLDIFTIIPNDCLDPILRGIAQKIRTQARTPDQQQDKLPITFDEDRIASAIRAIYTQIKPPSEKHLRPGVWPKIVIAIGQNSSDAAYRLATDFDALTLSYEPHLQTGYLNITIKNAIDQISGSVAPNQILFLDDVGHKGKTISSLKLMYPEAKFAVLALKDGSQVDQDHLADYFGERVPLNSHVFFPAEQVERLFPHQSVYALVGKKIDGQFKILLQQEDDEEWKIPGGTAIEDKDGGTLDTLRRELKEELGEQLRNLISCNLSHESAIEPFDITVPFDLALSESTANTLYIRGYPVLLINDDIDPSIFITPDGSPVVKIAWLSFEDVLHSVKKLGYQKLILAYYKWLIERNIIASNVEMEKLWQKYKMQ